MSMTKIRGQQIDLDSTQGIDVEAGGKLFVKTLSGGGVGFDLSGNVIALFDNVSINLPDGTHLSTVGFQNTTSDAVAGQGQVWFRTDSLVQFKACDNASGNNAGVFNFSLAHLNSLSGDAITNTTETTFSVAGTNVSYTFKANYFVASTRTFRVRATFILSTLTAITIRLKAYLGSAVIADTGAFTTAAGLSSAVVVWEFEVSCRSSGPSGTVVSTGFANVGTTTSVAGASHRSGSVTVASTVDQTLTLTGQLGASSGTSDSIAFETWDIQQIW